MIHFLDEGGRLKTRLLYETAFPEDSKEFVDYYYDRKVRNNDIMVMEEGDGLDAFQVMIHFNYYRLWINGELWRIPYIVAVAARPDCRRRGKMKCVMQSALKEMERRHKPFAFLMPKDPAYYRSQGFTFFPCQVQPGIVLERQVLPKSSKKDSLQNNLAMQHKEDDVVLQDGLWRKAEEQDIPGMVEFSNRLLKKKYQIFVWRDEDYYRRLLEETKAEHGGIMLMKLEGKIQGLLVYGMEEKMEIQELLLESDDSLHEVLQNGRFSSYEASFPSMNLMVRITGLFEFVSLMRSVKPRSYYIRLIDSVIDANNGCFHIKTGQTEGRIERTEETGNEQKMDIVELAQLLLADTQTYIREWV